MKYVLLSIIFLSVLNTVTFAQEAVPESEAPERIVPIIVPQITSEDFVPVNKSILFDADESSLLPEADAPPVYRWSFSDMQVKRTGKEVVRNFTRTGAYTVMLTIRQGTQEASIGKEIFVYDKRMFLVTDKDTATGLTEIRAQAAAQGVLLDIVEVERDETEYVSEENLVKTLAEKIDIIEAADAYVFYTKSLHGLKAFTRYWRGIEDEVRAREIAKKLYVVISDGTMALAAGMVQQSFAVVRPPYILLTRREALNPIFESREYSSIVNALEQRAIEFRIIDERSERSSAYLLSKLISQFVTRGVPSNAIYLLLAFPFIVFIIAFAREVLGLSAFGLYTPAMITTAFMILGIQFGLILLLLVVVIGWVVRLLIDRVELLFIPRTGLVLSSLALTFLITIWALLFLQSSVSIALAIFPMLVMSTVTEKFLAAQQEEGLQHAIWGVARTVIVVIAAYYTVTWTRFVNLLTSTPEYVLFPLIALFILGKFTGLRLSEYFRFRALLRGDAEE